MAYSNHALTSIGNVEAMLGLTAAAQDALLQLLINAASRRIERYCQRHFERASYSAEKHAGKGRQNLYLDNYPIIDTPTVTVNDMADTDFTVFAEEGYLWRDSGWDEFDYSEEGLAWQDRPASKEKRNVSVTYRAGYATPPWASRSFTGVSSVTITMANTACLTVGDTITLSNGTTTENRIIATVTADTNITVTVAPALTYTTTKTLTITQNLPEDLEMACIRLVALEYNLRASRGLVSEKTPGGYAVQYQIEGVVPQGKEFPDDVKSMLDPYRRIAFA